MAICLSLSKAGTPVLPWLPLRDVNLLLLIHCVI